MTEVIAYGLDFGTTNSALAAAFADGHVEVLEFAAGELVMPSLVYLNRDGNRLAGRQALRGFLDISTQRTSCGRCELAPTVNGGGSCKQHRPGSYCLDARLLSQVKSQLTDTDFVSTHSWGVDFELEDMVAAVIATMKRAADRHFGQTVTRVVLGHPVRFAGADGPDFLQLQSVALGRLAGAAERSGFTDVRLVAESQAAVAVDEIDEGIAVCTDFGGGTFDVAVIDVFDGAGNVLHLDGIAVGGEEFDAKIFEAVVRPALDLDASFTRRDGQTRQLPARVPSRLRSLSGLSSLLADDAVPNILSDYLGCGHDDVLQRVGDLLFGGQAWMFYRAIEHAKIVLSEAEAASIDFRRPGFDLHVPLKRAEFESLIEDDLESIRYCLQDSVAAAGARPDEVAFVTRTGGSSQIPAYARVLSELFPEATLIDRDPFTSVVTGLAEYAFQEWSHD